MCGIFGVTKFNKDNIQIARTSLHTLVHRGPDQWNDFYDNEVYIGHQRLSILDLSDSGKQPMFSHDQNVILTVNGEIYNYKELKVQLEVKYKFNSTSDSEVLLYGYIEWGIDLLLEKIDGMYSFMLYDKLKKEIFLVRDRYGIKPLYYSNLNSQFIWASELKAINKYYDESNILEYDYTALYDFLTYKYIPTPKSLYKNVFKLEPAHYLKIDITTNSFVKKQYWTLAVNKCDDDINMAISKISSLIKESVNEQMVADVPVGFFLSGGMDSSTVVSLAAENKTNLNTFSIGFSDSMYDESRYAEIVAKKYETIHSTKFIKELDIFELLPKIKDWCDEPFADTSCFPTFLVSKVAKQKTTVVLTGDGGDEIFGGYNWYKQFKKIKFRSSFIPNPIKRLFQKFQKKNNFLGKIANRYHIYLFIDDVEIYSILMGSMSKKNKINFAKRWNINSDYDDFWYYRKYYKTNLDLYTRLQYLDFHTYLHDDIFTKVDRTSMSVSLECRVPLVNKKIVEYCFSLNPKIRIFNGELKGILKETFKNRLPPVILSRHKKGFSIPQYNWTDLLGTNSIYESILKFFQII
jgi:asparagine synthase (glutamine-hydrolysing)